MASMERTRMALGSQIRVALDHMVGRGIFSGWKLETRDGGRLVYRVFGRSGATSACWSPGTMAEVARQYGYDVRIGSGTGEQVEA